MKLITILKRLKELLKGKPKQVIPPGTVYIGSIHSRKYHRDDCEYVNEMNYGCSFNDQREAADANYIPCKYCQPDRNPYRRDEWTPDFWGNSR